MIDRVALAVGIGTQLFPIESLPAIENGDSESLLFATWYPFPQVLHSPTEPQDPQPVTSEEEELQQLVKQTEDKHDIELLQGNPAMSFGRQVLEAASRYVFVAVHTSVGEADAALVGDGTAVN
jgi:hypothetical protein